MVFRRCTCRCETYFNVLPDEEQYFLSDFVFEDLYIEAEKNGFNADSIKNVVVKNVCMEDMV